MTEQRRSLTLRDFERMAIPERYWETNLDKVISNAMGPKGLVTTREVLQRYVENFGDMISNGWGLALLGGNGVGKTSSVAVLVKEIRRRGIPVYWIEAASIRDAVMDRKRFDADYSVAEWLREVPVLVIDDIGKGSIDKGWSREYYDALIRHRNGRKKVTFLTFNGSAADFASGDALARSTVSTLGECCGVYELRGDNMRAETAREIGAVLSGVRS